MSEERNHAANQQTLKGIDHLSRQEWPEALSCFEHAISLRESLPWPQHPEIAWGLAAGWMNRGDALTSLSPPRHAEAVQSYQRALEVLQAVPMEADPGCPERRLLATIRLATVLDEMDQLAEAELTFQEAARQLREVWAQPSPPRRLLNAMLHTNRARFHLRKKHLSAALDDARLGLDILRGWENEHPEFALASLAARSVWCRTLAEALDSPNHLATIDDWIAEATDTAEGALTLARTYQLRPTWLPDLLRYAARIYRRCQPQFLAEFLHEWIGPHGWLADDTALRQEMKIVIAATRAEAEQRLLIAPHDDSVVQREMRIIQSLPDSLFDD